MGKQDKLLNDVLRSFNMWMKWFKTYQSISLIKRILVGFVLGVIFGVLFWIAGVEEEGFLGGLIFWISPFGDIFVRMLKMLVIPIIFTSLVIGAYDFPISKFRNVGKKIIIWYGLTSLIATILGVFIAIWFSPGAGNVEGWAEKQKEVQVVEKAEELVAGDIEKSPVRNLILSFFENPFSALSGGKFLAVVVFSILLGIGGSILRDTVDDSKKKGAVSALINYIEGFRLIIFKILDWVLEYTPIGVFALSLVTFANYGPRILGIYGEVVLGVVVGILGMIFIVYPLMMMIRLKENPFSILKQIRTVMVTAFTTRSSAATLPVSLLILGKNLKIRNELSSFAMPIGATINMDGVCLHLPMFALLGANLFGVSIGFNELILLVLTTVFASVGAGGVPGGSLLLLFIILEAIGLKDAQIATIVALSVAVNPILDMFETMNNVTGDVICTYTVGKMENLIDG